MVIHVQGIIVVAVHVEVLLLAFVSPHNFLYGIENIIPFLFSLLISKIVMDHGSL